MSQVEELRAQLDDEKEAACAREREFAQRRYQKQLEQEEEAYQQQRRRLYTEVGCNLALAMGHVTIPFRADY